MLLKSLEIQGFKTFPDKTTLKFDRGITAVVGPNGSGKSNISDAVRWVLGEQSTRTLRCTRMEDVIFNGTPARKPQGYAEVTLTIDNSDRRLDFDGDTVAITRRYYRSGDSEYLINKVAVRLRDINELFMDTGLGRDGYSIIGQGKIDSIVGARSEDRREIFEEAAGISRFRYRKEESERRLSQAEENLLRLRDILSELEDRVGPLKEQAEKAQQYLEFASEKRTLEIGLWLNTLERSGHVLREHDDRIVIAKNHYDELEEQLAAIEQQIEDNFAQANACTAKVDEARQEAARMEEAAVAKDGEGSVLANDILHNRENIARIEREIEQSNQSGKDMDEEIAQKKAEIEEKAAFIAEKEAESAACTKRLEELRQGMGETAAQIDRYSRQIDELSTESTQEKLASMTAASTISEIQLRMQTVEQTLAEKRERAETLKQSDADFAKMLADTESRIQALSNTVKGYEMRLNSRRQRAEAAKKQSEKLHLDANECARRARLLEDLERNLEGFSQSVKLVMKEAKHGTLPGIHGPVSRLIKVPREYAVAIETALGPAMQNIVVGSEQDAKRAIGFLKQRDGGRATFLPLSNIRGNVLNEPGLEECPGVVGIAGKLCTCDEQYNGILHSLLGRIVVAEDLDAATAVARRYRYRFRIVTLDGQVVNAGGSLTGGSLARNSGLLSRASEIERIRAQADQLREQAEQAAAALRAANEEASAAEAALTGAKGELATAQEERIRIEAEHNRAKADRQTIAADIAALEQESAVAAGRLEEQRAIQKQAEQKLGEATLQISVLQGKMNEIRSGRSEQNQLSDTLSNQLQELRIESLSAQKDIESLRATIADIERRKEDRAGHVAGLRQEMERVQDSIVSLQTRIEELKKEAASLREQAKASTARIEELNAQRMAFEKKSAELRAKEREQSSARENVGHELARLEERKASLQKEYDEIISRLWEEYELTRREAEEVAAPIEDVGQSQKRLNELKGKIKALGTVNVAAVEEYKEVSERYAFMNAQVADVEQSRDELKRLIGDLTRQMRELFIERFKQINTNFLQTFQELFGGGTANLSLTDPEDILHSGIEISVQPPGKIVTHLELLSGGEKALVAIALYFAIMKVSPPPFCMLDEIEAALDDVNVDRFAAYLRRMTSNTQFIVITHRRGSMEEADVLYGVTMQDEGVSKLLELRASEIEQKLGMDAAK
ncbi:chromosome segregation protein SMC [Anaeromassilibacillus sp. An250]|uniref:chromosome segregation protein SMC n=1 Tax=Anaeromassilibacillus sp. An250 TaxID=1965604 RepID=UPI000B3AF3F2|nr:chromosome segregation protein SMC [Anaeromassilibacillus sp. An250]OUO74286.1 chromosome segregation protein SMC [Anaeromassilibacillus sp. An250]